MKTIKILAVCSVFLFAFSGCELEGLNVNPNETDDAMALTDALFSATLRDGFAIEGDDEQRVKALMIDFYSHIADAQGNFNTRNYQMMEDWNQRQYKRVHSTIYTLNLVINNLITMGEDKYRHSIAVAKIWRIFVHASGADFFGPIPFKSYKEEIENPPYLSLEDIYSEYFTELEEAVSMLDQTSEEPVFKGNASDIVYNNDITKWRKFANSLRLRYALRLSEVNQAICSTEAKKAIESGVMESKGDNANIPPRANGAWGQDYNYTMFQVTWSAATSMTTSFEKLVTGIGGIDFPLDIENQRALLDDEETPLTDIHPEKVDPRAPKMFDPGYEIGNWKGFPVGIPASSINNDEYKKNNYAEFGFLIKDGIVYKNRPYDMLLYEEICFLKAEAASRGFVSGIDAKSEYEKGVRASFETWGVSDKVDDYLTSTNKNLAGTSANFDDQAGPGNTALEKIITQKYLAAFPDIAMESWNDKRRLNLPRFDVLMHRYELFYDNSNKDIKDPKNFIKRVQYPQRELQVNKVEYDKGVQMLGGPDNVTTPLWWDMNSNYCTSVE